MKLLLWIATLGALCGQDLVGTWQGSISANGQERRIVIKIAGDSATLYPIDANARPIPSTAMTLQGSTLKITFVAGRLSYEGKLEGNVIAGELTQGDASPKLILTRATAATAWTIPEPPAGPTPMAANAKLVFEVATIKPSPPGVQNAPFRVQPGKIEILNRPLSALIVEAFGVHPSQIVGAKGWMETDRWDIVGKPEATGQPNRDQLRQIQQNLLVDRFHLKFHMEQRELPVYAILMGKTGQHKLTPTVRQGNLPSGGFRGAGVFNGANTSMADLAELLQLEVLDRPVVDKTGIAGRFDFTLQWRPDDFQFGGRLASMQKPPNVDALPDLFTAFQEQLGLKIDAVKLPTSVFVIDSADRPSEN